LGTAYPEKQDKFPGNTIKFIGLPGEVHYAFNNLRTTLLTISQNRKDTEKEPQLIQTGLKFY
jgi:hypothetical protein